MEDVSGCDDLWKDTECTKHTGYVRDTCQKSCGTCQGNIYISNGISEIYEILFLLDFIC